MYHATSHAFSPSTDRRASTATHATRYRSRDFGTGYGSSSGYAVARRYAPAGQPAPRFRLG